MSDQFSEAQTRRELIDPALEAAGWDNAPHSVTPEETITDGRVIPLGQKKARRGPQLRADYVLREMRDAAGDSGEFYTPRPVVQFMVKVVDPRLGEIVYDPAAGTGGFLVESFTHLERQVKTVEERRQLHNGSIIGAEAKPLPYLLAQMNLLLHGLESPQIDPQNSLRFRLSEIGDKV